MQLFYEMVFNGFVSGNQPIYTQDSLAALLGSADVVTVVGQALSVSGTSVTITCQFEQSPDGVRWSNQNTTPELNGLSLGTNYDTSIAPFCSNPSGASVLAGNARLRISFGGSSPSCLLRIYASGRTF